MSRSVSLPLLPLFLTLAACGGGGLDPVGGDDNIAPAVEVTSPTDSVEIGLSEGGVVPITYVDMDPDDEAVTMIVADGDGDANTTDDQVLIDQRLEQDGVEQTVRWDVTDVDPGSYRILALTRDKMVTVVGEAPGMVLLNAASTLTISEPSEDVVVSRGGFLHVSNCQA